MATLLALVGRHRAQAQIRHVRPVSPERATGRVASVYAQVERDFGMLAPPVSLHSPAPPALAASWLMLRESLLATGRVSRAVKEAVAAAVSLGNTCPYCVDVHGATLHGLLRDGDAAAAVAVDRLTAIVDGELRRVALWARSSGRGPSGDAVPASPDRAAEIVGVAVTFQYLNRMVNVFLSPSPIPASVPGRAREAARRVLGRLMAAPARRAAPPGAALPLLPEAPLPPDLSWAAGSPAVAAAFARAAAAIEAGGHRSVPAPVRELVQAELAAWNGAPRGPSRAWLDRPVAGLAAMDRPSGRLALLVAFASYQVDDAVIGEFRRAGAGDRELVELASWASLAAARRTGGWARIAPTAKGDCAGVPHQAE
jgi:AhpD family alkylhydroperoxidase